MNKSDISSILNTVDSIVNQKQQSDSENLVASLIMEAMYNFEEMFDIQLDEEQIDQLTELSVGYLLSAERNNPKVDLSESADVLMEKHEPQDVFLTLLEVAAAGPAIIAALRTAGTAAATSAGSAIGTAAANAVTNKTNKGLTGSESTYAPDTVGDETGNPYSIYGQMSQDALARMQDDSELRYQGYMGEEATQTNKKHKKKVFKISFMDKGVKKRGTAVSHKGVMRIVHGKSVFKVYDENNKDVTSQFKAHGKKEK